MKVIRNQFADGKLCVSLFVCVFSSIKRIVTVLDRGENASMAVSHDRMVCNKGFFMTETQKRWWRWYLRLINMKGGRDSRRQGREECQMKRHGLNSQFYGGFSFHGCAKTGAFYNSNDDFVLHSSVCFTFCMTDTSSYTMEERPVVSVRIHEKGRSGQTNDVMRAKFHLLFNKFAHTEDDLLRL
jgi:hypothetical protein